MWSGRAGALVCCVATACAAADDGLEAEREVSAVTATAGVRVGSDDGYVRVESERTLRTAPGVSLVPVSVGGAVVYRTIGGRPGLTTTPQPTYVCACGGGQTCTGSCLVVTGGGLNDCSGRCTAQGRACGSCAWRMQLPRTPVLGARAPRGAPVSPRGARRG
jgi:hypothetical protein